MSTQVLNVYIQKFDSLHVIYVHASKAYTLV